MKPLDTVEADHPGYLGKVVAAFLVLFAAWGAADVALTVADKSAPTLLIPQEYVEGLGLAMRRGFQYEATYVNSLGMRRSELPPSVPGEVRILVLGDSVTFGYDVSNGNDWPGMLEKYLRGRGVPATVMNAGAPGQLTDFMFAALKYYTARVKVDIVLVQNSGNMLALGERNPGLMHGPQPVIDRLFPDARAGSLRPPPQCPDMSLVQDRGEQNVSVPAIVKRLSPHSPAVNAIATALAGGPKRTPAARNRIPEACFSPLEGNDFLVREMVSMAQMADYAKREGIALAFVRPTYVFDWAGPDGTGVPRERLPAEYRNGYKGSWALVENVDRMFDFFERSGVRMVDPMSRLRALPATSIDVGKLYGDHTHYTAEGCRLVAGAVGDELLARGMLAPVSAAPWKHPAERANPRDLKYRDLPSSLSLARIAGLAVLVTVATFMAGLAWLGAAPGAAVKSLAAAPMLGVFALLAAGLIANLLSLDAHGPILAVIAAAVVAIAWRIGSRRLDLRRVAIPAAACAGVAAAAAILAVFFLGHPIVRDPVHVKNLQTEIAWGEYLLMDDDPVLQVDLVQRQRADGIARPHMVVNVATSNPRVVQPASPAIAVAVSRITGAPIQDSVIAISAAFAAALAMFAFAAPWPRLRRSVAAALAALAILAFAALRLPSPLAMTLATGVALACLALAWRDRLGLAARLALLAAAGAMLYQLPAMLFLAVAGAIVLAAAGREFAGTRDLRGAVRAGLAAAVAMLAARAILFDLPVVDPRLALLLDPNHLDIAWFFL